MYVYTVKSMSFGMGVGQMQKQMCECDRDDYRADELHYARCIRCMCWIDGDTVVKGWDKLYPSRKEGEEE